MNSFILSKDISIPGKKEVIEKLGYLRFGHITILVNFVPYSPST